MGKRLIILPSPSASPVLFHDDDDEGGDEPQLASLSAPLLERDHQQDDEIATSLENQSSPSHGKCCSGRRLTVSAAVVKNASLIVLFVTSAVYQIYAGLKVSTFPSDQSTTLLVTLMCLSVLWINVAAQLFRTILLELTRNDGMFLSPEIHRHPVFFEDSKGVALHWCDLCRQRIGPDTNGAGRSGCYRCSLCDFDICLKCAERSDAATVGENMLRGDRGVRVEASMDNTSYFKRSLAVARSEVPLLMVSFSLLAVSSVSRLFLPHLQGKIIDQVIPDQTDGHQNRSGFSYYIKLYVILMLVQGAVSTLYSAIFTLVSRRLKFTIRNSLLERYVNIIYYTPFCIAPSIDTRIEK